MTMTYETVRERFTALWRRADEIDAPYVGPFAGDVTPLPPPPPTHELRQSFDWSIIAHAINARQRVENETTENPDAGAVGSYTWGDLFDLAHEAHWWQQLGVWLTELEERLDRIETATEWADDTTVARPV